MRSGLLTSSRFGKFYTRSEENIKTVELTTAGPLEQARFTISGDRLYLLDGSGNLTCLSLSDNSISTFGSIKLSHFVLESNNSYSVYAISRQSQLWHISFENKKRNKLLNLNLGRIINFQKNHFTNLLLIVEFQVVMLIDLSVQGSKIRAIHASNGDVFSGGRFLNQNRFILLAVKSNELRVVEILGMKTIDKLTLPFEIKGIKLETTFNGSAVAVFGESNLLVVVHITQDGKMGYQLAELPIKSILALKFTHQDDIIFLANNRILYGISHHRRQLVELFNSEEKIRFSSFDISINACSIALIAGKTVYTLSYPQGIRKILEVSQGEVIEFSEQGVGEQNLRVDRQIVYDDQDLEQDPLVINPGVKVPPNLPNFAITTSNHSIELLSQVQKLKVPRSQKMVITTIYHYLHKFQTSKKLVQLHRDQVVAFIQSILAIFKDPKQSSIAVYQIITLLGATINDGLLETFAHVLAPRVFEKIQKVDCEFGEFVTRNLLNLFEDYVEERTRIEILRVLLRNCHREWFLPFFVISLFLQMRANNPSWPLAHIQKLNLAEVLDQTQNLMSNNRFSYLLNKQQPQGQLIQGQDLQTLLRRQEQLKQTLEHLRGSSP